MKNTMHPAVAPPLALRYILVGLLVSATAGCDLTTAPAEEEPEGPPPGLPHLGSRWVSAGPDTLRPSPDPTAGYCVLGPVEITLTGAPEAHGPVRGGVRYPGFRSGFSLECHGAEQGALEVFPVADSVRSYPADTTSISVAPLGWNPFAGEGPEDRRWSVRFEYTPFLGFSSDPIGEAGFWLEGAVRWERDDGSFPPWDMGRTRFRVHY